MYIYISIYLHHYLYLHQPGSGYRQSLAGGGSSRKAFRTASRKEPEGGALRRAFRGLSHRAFPKLNIEKVIN